MITIPTGLTPDQRELFMIVGAVIQQKPSHWTVRLPDEEFDRLIRAMPVTWRWADPDLLNVVHFKFRGVLFLRGNS